jgi:recombinational DNA repair protein RecR
MAVVYKCDECDTITESNTGLCSACKEKKEKEHSEGMNKEAVERIKRDVLTQEEADRIASVFFEDDEVIKLRDGKTYHISPSSLKNARKLMSLLKTVNIDVVMLNFIPTGNGKKDEQRINDLYDILSIAFVNYPKVTKEYIEEYVDVVQAKEIINVLIGLNGLKK